MSRRLVTVLAGLVLAFGVAPATAAPPRPTDGIWYGGLSFRVIDVDGHRVVANASTNPGFPVYCGGGDYTIRVGRKLAVSPAGTFSYTGSAPGLGGLRVRIEGSFDADGLAHGTYEISDPAGACSSPVTEWGAERVDTPPGLSQAQELSARAAFLHCRQFSNCTFHSVVCRDRRSGFIACKARIKLSYGPEDATLSSARFLWERRGEELRLVSRTEF